MSNRGDWDRMTDRQRQVFEQWEREQAEKKHAPDQIDQPPKSAIGPPAGWYPHPGMVNTQRYWDGSNWTDHIAPGAPARSPQAVLVENARTTGNLELWGWLGALFLPIVGIIIGIVLLSRPGKNQGGAILAVAAGWIVLAVIIWSANQPTTY